ncbi:hypothetical protein CTA2_9810 [Colletotrichum tanaceti]|uniref:Uncharacterized protein n=1 Tax=Colletotrichum tanaceti TaxID=1306861 RepID=A0A4U6XAB7_9PEZI|nr:hypothetical protein CTA2_9810 [Colletotrichum tanaceti]TKW52039.1 hypothetical protein CTA1_10848 [Colletotrichum tanaceti]
MPILFSARSIFCAALSATIPLNDVQAQVADHPFDINGAFEGAVASTTAFNSGGTIKCNDQSVTVPKNLQVTYPAAFIGFRDFVTSSGGYIGYSCEITGNVVNGVAIAAQVPIAQALLNGASGRLGMIMNDDENK